MEDSKLGIVEDTLFVPMLGRIYASERCKAVLYDAKALELKARLPRSVVDGDGQTQYAHLASAARSASIDRFISDFLHRKPDGIVVQLGVGLETAFFRNDNGRTQWYGIDLPHVIDYRRELLPDTERERLIAGSAFEVAWLEQVRTENPGAPLLTTASGLFHYFEEARVIDLVRMLQDDGNVELIFDAVSKAGLSMMRKKHLKTIGHEDAQMHFCVESADELAARAGGDAKVLAEEGLFGHVDKSGLQLSTRLSMGVSDLLRMVKIIHLQLFR